MCFVSPDRDEPSSDIQIQSWTWSEQPSSTQLQHCMSTLVREQLQRATLAANTTVSAHRLQQRYMLIQRLEVTLLCSTFTKYYCCASQADRQTDCRTPRATNEINCLNQWCDVTLSILPISLILKEIIHLT